MSKEVISAVLLLLKRKNPDHTITQLSPLTVRCCCLNDVNESEVLCGPLNQPLIHPVNPVYTKEPPQFEDRAGLFILFTCKQWKVEGKLVDGFLAHLVSVQDLINEQFRA